MIRRFINHLTRIWNSVYILRFRTYVKEFPYIWALLFVLYFVTVWANDYWQYTFILSGGILILLTLLILILPMNAVYGLMGTSGSIRLFFLNFLLITFLFSRIYYLGFFQNTGISYDVNQPHIDYHMFADSKALDSTKVVETRDTVFLEHIIDSVTVKEIVIHAQTEELNYQRIGFWDVWKCTILTTLTQEPADLFACATIYNESMDGGDCELDRQKSELFHWILIFHIIISWIFFGVFISLLYNKFRYES